MERYTTSQIKRALAQEQLLCRLERGDDFEVARQELGLSLSPASLPYLRRRYRGGGCSWEALIDHRRGRPYKLSAERCAWLRERKLENPALTQEELASRYAAEFQETISQGHVSNVLRAEGVAIPGGKHCRLGSKQAQPMERAGVFFPPGRRLADGPAQHRYPGHSRPQSNLPGP